MDYQTSAEQYVDSTPGADTAMELDLSLFSSVALARLAEEVKNDMPSAGKYDRVHNRHNR